MVDKLLKEIVLESDQGEFKPSFNIFLLVARNDFLPRFVGLSVHQFVVIICI